MTNITNSEVLKAERCGGMGFSRSNVGDSHESERSENLSGTQNRNVTTIRVFESFNHSWKLKLGRFPFTVIGWCHGRDSA